MTARLIAERPRATDSAALSLPFDALHPKTSILFDCLACCQGRLGPGDAVDGRLAQRLWGDCA